MSHIPAPSTPFASDDPVMKVAIAMFQRDGWIDARLLAKEAGIGRATIYRKYGDRDRILGEVVWATLLAIGEGEWGDFQGRGADGIAEAIGRSLRAVAEMPAVRRFVSEHTDTALRVMASGHGVVQQRLIASIALLITLEIGDPPDIDAESLAYAVVRVSESFYHRELITGDPPDFAAATVIIKRLLDYRRTFPVADQVP
ncbi:QsdR family transcriptional regulator [Nocardia sp. NPDC006630]|uniref:QsdR family transcriptional regulator n=1 Tax=Nocardia sp. NPDC006630 TaxID=3157181 RepID=UPI0033A2A2BF